jgi:hypothetical protein
MLAHYSDIRLQAKRQAVEALEMAPVQQTPIGQAERISVN